MKKILTVCLLFVISIATYAADDDTCITKEHHVTYQSKQYLFSVSFCSKDGYLSKIKITPSDETIKDLPILNNDPNWEPVWKKLVDEMFLPLRK